VLEWMTDVVLLTQQQQQQQQQQLPLVPLQCNM
jgi:hypothetical protein